MAAIGLIVLLGSFLVVSQDVGSAAGLDALGPRRVEIREYRLLTSGASHPLEITLVLPEDSGDGPVPLVLFNHGFMLRGQDYLSYGVHLGSHGLAVALPTYPMSPLSADHRVLAAQVLFVAEHLVEQARTGFLSGLVDPERLALVGHSLGGKLSLLVASGHPSVAAVAALDPVDGGAPGVVDEQRFPRVVPEAMAEVRVPVLLLGAELGGQVGWLHACAPVESNYQRFFDAATAPAIEVTQMGAGHMQYLDDPEGNWASSVCAGGSVPSADVRRAAQGYLTAFFLAHLCGSQEALLWLGQRLSADEEQGRIRVRVGH